MKSKHIIIITWSSGVIHRCLYLLLQLYVSQNQAEDKKRSVREQLLKAISEQEKKSKLLKAEQTKVNMTKYPVLGTK